MARERVGARASRKSGRLRLRVMRGREKVSGHERVGLRNARAGQMLYLRLC